MRVPICAIAPKKCSKIAPTRPNVTQKQRGVCVWTEFEIRTFEQSVEKERQQLLNTEKFTVGHTE